MDEWDDDVAVSTPAYNNKIDEGHSLSRGRGFSSFNNDDGKLLNK